MGFAEMDVTLTELCSHPPDCVPNAITSDGHVIAFCPEPDGRVRFRWDGVAGEPFDGLGELRDNGAALYASEDGAHIAYVGMRGAMIFVGRDDREDPPFHAFSRSVPPTFGGGGRHLAYGAQVDGDDYQLILDGVSLGRSAIAPTAAVFSPDGERLAYMEMRGERRGEVECRIILDGRPGDWFAGTRNAPNAMQFSPDGRRFAYYAIDGNGHARWVVDGVPQRLFNEVPSMTLTRIRGISVLEAPLFARFSPDSQRFAYFADVVEKGVAIVEDDVPGPLFKGVRPPIFSSDSRHLAYAAETDAKALALVVDGAVKAEWPASVSGDPIFSADSRRVAIAMQREVGGLLRKRRFATVAVDDHDFPEELADDCALSPAFSPDGSRVAWWLQRGADTVLVVDGVPHPEAGVIEGEVRFDTSGRLIVASQIGNGHTITVDGRPGPLADAVVELLPLSDFFRQPWPWSRVHFRLAKDGPHVAWAGVFGGEARPVFDDEVGPSFDAVFECRIAGDGTATWWAQRGDVVFRVERNAA